MEAQLTLRWTPASDPEAKVYTSVETAIARVDRPLFVLNDAGVQKYATGGGVCGPDASRESDGIPLLAYAPACPPAALGDRAFCEAHGVTFPCYAGSMAHGIASEAMVVAMGAAGMLGFFGSAGLARDALLDAIKGLAGRMGNMPFGFNLINSPGNADWENNAVALFLEHDIRLVEASAYIRPTAALIKYRVTGLRQEPDGTISAKNNIIAKVSRAEIAQRFLAPPPEKVLKKLLLAGDITEEEAVLATRIPLAQDITAEADSGGHTDHRAALALLPNLQRVRDEIQQEYRYHAPPRIGLAGGIGTPQSVAAAFAMGAAYVVTGSVNQACIESGTSPQVRAMLAEAAQTDVADAPAADMFEMGATVQVLKRGTRFAERAAKLYDLYRNYDGIDALPPHEREKIETKIFRAPLAHIWEETCEYFKTRNLQQLKNADENPKKKMALIFKWYLGNAAQWANCGVEDRREDFQIWCGPAMGAFNDWTRGTFLETPANRRVADVSLQLLHGAAKAMRVQTLRQQGVVLPAISTLLAPDEALATATR